MYMCKLILTIDHGYNPQGNKKKYDIHSYKFIVNECRKDNRENITNAGKCVDHSSFPEKQHFRHTD